MHYLRYLKQEPGFYRSALLLMIPMILQNFVTNCMQLADTFMVGALGEVELAAVTMANSLFFVLSLMIFGIQSGASVLVAQYNGRDNKEAINRVMGMGYYVSLSLTTVVALASFFFPREIMRIITNNPLLIEPGADYMRIVGFSYIAMSISGIYISVQRSMENPKLGAYLLTFSGCLNIFLNYMFIFGKLGAPAMGCAGAALATLISRMFEVVVVAIYATRSRNLPFMPKKLLCPGKIIARDFAKYSLPVICNEGLWSFAVALYSVIMGHMANNTPIVAAYTIAGNVDRLVAVALFAAGNAAAVIIGREIGRKADKESLYSKGVALNLLCLATGIVTGCVLLLVRAFVVDAYVFPLLNMSAEASSIAKFMLLVIAIVMPLRACNLCNVVGVFRGGGDVHYGLLVDVLPMYLLTVPATALTALLLGCDIRIVYICMSLDEIVKIFLCLPRLRNGKWINSVTRDEIA
ncbi:MAG: MATE family efflux transporter [Oscillospiraceae bacterium]